MITEADRITIEQVSRKYHAKRVMLFGSSLSQDQTGRDIDLGVEGVAGKDFFAFYGELMFALSKPVDVVDLSVKSLFVDLVKKEGVVVYA